MSFSSEVKEELAKKISPARHCQMAELAAIMSFCGQYGRQEGSGLYVVGFQTENEAVVTWYFFRRMILDSMPKSLRTSCSCSALGSPQQ